MADRVAWQESRLLPVVLGSEELRARGESLARAVKRVAEIEAEHYAAREEMREALKKAEGVLQMYATIVADRSELRVVEVECVLSVPLQIVEEHRTDTGEHLGTRPAEPRDKLRLQQVLPLFERPHEEPPHENLPEAQP